MRIHHHLGRRRYVIHKHASAFAYMGRHVPLEDRADGVKVYKPNRRAAAARQRPHDAG